MDLANNLEYIIHQVEPDMIDYSLYDYHKLLMEANHCIVHQDRERTLGYQLISSSLGVPFLAHPCRDPSYLTRGSDKLFTRKDIIKKLIKSYMIIIRK